jgi:hypothetical protein
MPTPTQFREVIYMDKKHAIRDIHSNIEQVVRTPEADSFLAGDIVVQWACREHYRRQLAIQQAEVLKLDVVLGELLYRLKRKLSQLGRNGQWKAWLDEHRISRSTSDRLSLEHAEYHGLTDELPHRSAREPLEGAICSTAYRTSDRLQNMLKSPQSRMKFIAVLADMFDLSVDWDGDAAHVRIPVPVDEATWINQPMPTSIEMQLDGTAKPIIQPTFEGEDDLPI